MTANFIFLHNTHGFLLLINACQKGQVMENNFTEKDETLKSSRLSVITRLQFEKYFVRGISSHNITVNTLVTFL